MSSPQKVKEVMTSLQSGKEVHRRDISQALGFMQYVFNKKAEHGKTEEMGQANNVINYLKGKL